MSDEEKDDRIGENESRYLEDEEQLDDGLHQFDFDVLDEDVDENKVRVY